MNWHHMLWVYLLLGATALLADVQPAAELPEARAQRANGQSSATGLDAPHYAGARANAAAANMRLSQAELAVNTMPVLLRNAYEQSAEYRAAKAELKEAQQNHEMARNKVIAGLEQTDPAYRSALEQQQNLARVLAAGNLSAKERLDVAARKMEAGNTASKILAEALEADTTANQAKTRMLTAARAVSDMKDRFDADLRNNAEFRTARANLQTARVEAAAANSYVSGLAEIYNHVLAAYYYTNRDRYGQGYAYPYYRYPYYYSSPYYSSYYYRSCGP